MKDMKHFLVPELVPLENKGEEAIVRGIGDVVFQGEAYEIHLFDEVEDYYFKDGVHVYPVKWFMSPWLNREFGLGVSYEKIRDSLQSLIRNLLHKIYPSWVCRKDRGLLNTIRVLTNIKNGESCPSEYRGLENILKLDYIIAGHDGAMDERVCHIVDLLQSILDIPLGVFGIEFPQSFKSKYIVSEQYRVLRRSKFFYCRTKASKAVVDKYFPDINAFVKPDPAFGMSPSSAEKVDEFLESNGLLELFDKPVIVCTTCETGPIARYCFENVASPSGKLEAHRKLYAKLIDHVVNKLDVSVLFLPHAIGPGKALDDRFVAEEVISKLENPEKAHLLRKDISGVLLKAIISKSEFLIAERIHSMIGAVSVNTPFMCLGSKTDRRINGILGEMAGAVESVFYMNSPNEMAMFNKFDTLWEKRGEEKNRLRMVSDDFARQHKDARDVISEEFKF